MWERKGRRVPWEKSLYCWKAGRYEDRIVFVSETECKMGIGERGGELGWKWEVVEGWKERREREERGVRAWEEKVGRWRKRDGWWEGDDKDGMGLVGVFGEDPE